MMCVERKEFFKVVCRSLVLPNETLMMYASNLTVGKIYQAYGNISNEYIEIRENDSGINIQYHSDMFVTLNVYRNQKMDKLLK